MSAMPEHGHEPVMVGEIMALLSPHPGETAMDCTAGRGGHAAALAKGVSPGGKLIALDVDPNNLAYARKRVEEAVAVTGGEDAKTVEIRAFHANFGEASDVLATLELEGVDLLLADFGVSTNQLLEAKHGLSFNEEAPLDMRLDPRIRTKASDLLAELGEKELADILYENAQERHSYKIARKIITTRATEPIRTTGQLARLVRSVVPAKWGQIDPATRTFQALRMAVNRETESLQDFLASVPGLLRQGARAAFMSFHSGEDRLVKQAVKGWEDAGLCEVLTKKPAEPGEAELARNPRSRSAKLRAVRWLAIKPANAGAKPRKPGRH